MKYPVCPDLKKEKCLMDTRCAFHGGLFIFIHMQSFGTQIVINKSINFYFLSFLAIIYIDPYLNPHAQANIVNIIFQSHPSAALIFVLGSTHRDCSLF